MTTETVKEEVLGTSIAETVRRTVKIRDGIWWCPFCDRSAQIILHKVCADPQCAAKLTIEGGKLASAIRMVIRTEPVEPQITTDTPNAIQTAVGEPQLGDVYRDADGTMRVRQLPPTEEREAAAPPPPASSPDVPTGRVQEGEEIVRPSERVAEGLHLCTECGRRFKALPGLARHRSAMHGIKHPKAGAAV